EITELGNRLKKCSTGYCLDQLIMGSEGTLGIITKATLKLLPLCPYKIDILAVFTDVKQAVDLVPNLIKAGLNPTSIEFMDNGFVRAASDFTEIRLPHYEDGSYVIVTVETFNEDELDMKMEQLDEICTQCGATDVLEADERVWRVRRNCLEGTRVLSKVSTSDDLVVPVDKIADCIEHLQEVAKDYNFKLMCLAHAGDGNLHFQILKCDMSDEQWEDELQRFHAIAYEYVYSLGGRISGEHGIGAKKLAAMETYTDPVELEIMRTIKRAMDPNNILNPGKVFNV
ncbi:MAG: FAD-binding protein, partial [Phascolarctobacterium sp.]|nr:FAD-binding protein [Phascolarctobacterium sp.]